MYHFSAKASGFLPESFEECLAFQSFFVILRASFLFRGSAGEQDTEILGEEAVLLSLFAARLFIWILMFEAFEWCI